MAIQASTVGKIIIFGSLGILATKAGIELPGYISENVAQIRAENKYAEYQKQKEADEHIRAIVRKELVNFEEFLSEKQRRRY